MAFVTLVCYKQVKPAVEEKRQSQAVRTELVKGEPLDRHTYWEEANVIRICSVNTADRKGSIALQVFSQLVAVYIEEDLRTRAAKTVVNCTTIVI